MSENPPPARKIGTPLDAGRNGNSLIVRLDFYEAMLDAGKFTRAALHIAYKLLYRHMNGTTGRCDPARATLVEETGLSEESVKRAIRELAESGWWIVGRNEGTAGRGGRPNTYQPNLGRGVKQPPPSEPKEGSGPPSLSVGRGVTQPPKGGSRTTPKPRKNLEDLYMVDRSATDPVDEGALGEVFWRAYPSRSPHPNPKKPALLKLTAALKRGVDPTAIIRGAENYARYVEQHVTDPQRVAQALTWLSQERWNDHQDPAHAPRRRLGAGLFG